MRGGGDDQDRPAKRAFPITISIRRSVWSGNNISSARHMVAMDGHEIEEVAGISFVHFHNTLNRKGNTKICQRIVQLYLSWGHQKLDLICRKGTVVIHVCDWALLQEIRKHLQWSFNIQCSTLVIFGSKDSLITQEHISHRKENIIRKSTYSTWPNQSSMDELSSSNK